ncbi:MAG: hypothetical protein HY236_07365 [Acidobacteria bacterium]|nr:hypothetical protein [Acidobacteriota bacterium]
MTRRTFLGAAAAALGARGASSEGVCVTLCNHWSYIGIGWQLGIESSVLSVTDAMEMAERAPGVKTCINLDARAYEILAEQFPEIAGRLKRSLAEGKVELIGGTYSQPMGTMFSGESNIRQMVVGRETIRRALGYEVVTFLEEEEFTHPQIPQIAAGAGFKYASLAQVDTWGSAGIPLLEVNAFLWKGKDGATIPSTPKNSLFLEFSPKLDHLSSMPGYGKLRSLGKPLVFTWEEFGWESAEKPTYLAAPEKYRQLAARLPVEFVTLKEYMDKYGAARETVYFDMDSWNKLLTWGLGGDQLRALDRKVEALLLTAERFDAIAATLGGESQANVLERAWRDLLASQSHDVGLCEYSRWQGDRMAPLDRLEDRHNFTWGAIGYDHLDAARKQTEPVLQAAMSHIAGHVRATGGSPGDTAITVFNPCGWERSGIVETGRIRPLPADARDVMVRDHEGRIVPSQGLQPAKDGVAQCLFLAERAPALGYATYYLQPVSRVSTLPQTELRLDEAGLALENEFVKVRLDRTTGAVAGLTDKKTGREMLATPFPVFRGKPNPSYTPRSVFGGKRQPMPEQYDSAASNAEIDWVERGPLRASVRARHAWPLLKFETRVNLYARLPYVEVISRVLSEVPPLPDELNARGRFPVEIMNGYWLSFTPAFPVTMAVRDFPLAMEATAHAVFHALTFVDLADASGGLLVLHPGTQYFKRTADGAVSNLIMREWESYWTGEYGWPRYAEYRHLLLPHGTEFSSVQRMRASAEFSQRLAVHLGKPGQGGLPPRKSFLSLGPDNVQLLAFRKKPADGYELRVAEVEGRDAAATMELAVPISGVRETNLIGERIGDARWREGRIHLDIRPWQVRTFELV